VDGVVDKDNSAHRGLVNNLPTRDNVSDFAVPPNYQTLLSESLPQPLQFDRMGSIEQKSHFKKVQNFKADYTEAEVTQYESQRTGMRVAVVDRKGPKVRR
jgi:carotenoid cleavage dioxygenase-like enzyme